MPHRHFRLIAALAVAAWFAFVAGLFALIWLAGLRDAERRFLETVAGLKERIESRLMANALVLDGFAGLVAANPSLEPELLTRYAGEVLARHPHVFALEVAECVPAARLAAFERAQQQTHPRFRVRTFRYEADRSWAPVPAKSVYCPITFMAPLRPGSEDVLGLDLDSVPFLAAALAQSDRQNDFAMSIPFRLVEGNLGYVLTRPANRQGNAVQHHVLLVVDAEKLVRPLAEASPAAIALRLQPIHEATALFERRAPTPQGADRLLPRLARTLRVEVSGQNFVLEVEQPLSWRDLPRVALVAVAAISLLALVLMLILLRIRFRLERERWLNERRLTHLATHDPLTRLPNRALLMDRFEQAVRHARRTGRGFALLFIDLDGFKGINDQHGHHVGDLLLKTIAQRLRGSLRAGDTVARMSGDEFVVLLEETGSQADLEALIGKLRSAIATPMTVNDALIIPAASIGLARYPEDGTGWQDLLRAADQRMYAEKRARAR